MRGGENVGLHTKLNSLCTKKIGFAAGGDAEVGEKVVLKKMSDGCISVIDVTVLFSIKLFFLNPSTYSK